MTLPLLHPGPVHPLRAEIRHASRTETKTLFARKEACRCTCSGKPVWPTLSADVTNAGAEVPEEYRVERARPQSLAAQSGALSGRHSHLPDSLKEEARW